MSLILCLAAAGSILFLTAFALMPQNDFVWMGPNGLRLELERLESDVCGKYRVHCPALPELHGQVAPLPSLTHWLQAAGFKCL